MGRNILEDNPVQVSNVRTPTIVHTAGAEHVIFVAPYDCFLRKISVVSDNTADHPDFNFWKGPSASAASIRDAFITALVVDVAADIGALDKANRYIPKGTAVTVEEGTGGSATVNTPVFTVEYSRA
jgi:hypothetical protein